MYTADRGSVKLIDFGISHIMLPPPPKKEKDDPIDPDLRELFCPSDLRKRVGTPSFLAPEVVWFSDDSSSSKDRVSFEIIPTASSHAGSETVVVVQTFPMPKARPPITPAIDVWSLGVTFYCLLFGHTPFNGSSSENQTEFMLYHQICTQGWRPEERMGADQVPTCGRHPTDPPSEGFSVMQLLEGMLQKHPKDRISLNQVKVRRYCDLDLGCSSNLIHSVTLSFYKMFRTPRNGSS
jgi:[calcium/calmodulin-dependent protein kinase] kinase